MCIKMVDSTGYACHLGRRLAAESRRNGSSCLKIVARPIVGHPAPVDAPNVLAPPQHLANEPLDRIDRQVSLTERRLSGLNHLGWVQQSKIHA